MFKILRNANGDYKESSRGIESKNSQLWTMIQKKRTLIGTGRVGEIGWNVGRQSVGRCSIVMMIQAW